MRGLKNKFFLRIASSARREPLPSTREGPKVRRIFCKLSFEVSEPYDKLISGNRSDSVLAIGVSKTFTQPQSKRVGLARRGFALGSPVYRQPRESGAQFSSIPEISTAGVSI